MNKGAQLRWRHWYWLILALPVVLGLLRLRFDVEVLNLLPGDLSVVQGLKLYQAHFSNARELIITVEGEDADTVESATRGIARRLGEATHLVESVSWQPAWMEKPAQAAELIAYLWMNQPPAVFANLVGRLTDAEQTLAESREQLTTSMSPMDMARRGYDPYNLLELPESVSSGGANFGGGDNLFASTDGTFRLMFVMARPALRNYQECRDWLQQVNAVVRPEKGANPKVRIRETGGPVFVAEISQGMQHDMTASVGLTSVIIAILFWIFHRRVLPMLWLLVLLALILTATLGFGGLIFRSINVVSLGFAAILLGLAVDYGVVHYQEAMASPHATVPEIRRSIGPSIFWAAFTTISAFLVLNLGGLPGLAQLGTLVGVGIALSALVMLFGFLPPLFYRRALERKAMVEAGVPVPPEEAPHDFFPPVPARQRNGVVIVTLALILISLLVLGIRGWPRMDSTANALRPRKSEAYQTLDLMKAKLLNSRDPLWVLIGDRDEQGAGEKLKKATVILEAGRTAGRVQEFTLPTTLWPERTFQSANRVTITPVLSRLEDLRARALQAGFTTNSMIMTERMFASWRAASENPNYLWPTNELSRWILSKTVAQTTNGILAAGFVWPDPSHKADVGGEEWAVQLEKLGFVISGWELLGSSVFKRVKQNLWILVAPMLGLILLSLFLAFRRPSEIILSLFVMTTSFLGLLAIMRLFGWSWNLLNLMALPLMLGSGIDYSIFMQLALRRYSGDRRAAHRAVGRALLLCGGTAIAGFGSLALSSNAGMASLGAICAIGIGLNMILSVALLPVWWRMARSSV